MTFDEERQFIREHSPDALPLNTSESGWTAEQIRTLFVKPIYFLHELLNAHRESADNRFGVLETNVGQLQSTVEGILNGAIAIGRAVSDGDGRNIANTYETKEHASQTYETKTDASNTYATKVELAQKSSVSVSAVGSSTNEGKYIIVNGVEYKLTAETTLDILFGFGLSYDEIDKVLSVDDTVFVLKSETTSFEKNSNKSQTIDSDTTKYPSNKAVRDFINSSIAANAANYISNNGQPFTSYEQLVAYTGEVTNNDYAIVTGTDASTHSAYYDRYKATVSGEVVSWAKEYRLNNSTFTDAQWAAINSGITSALVESLAAHLSDTDSHIQSGERAYWNAKLDTGALTNVAYQNGNNTWSGQNTFNSNVYFNYGNIEFTRSLLQFNAHTVFKDMNSRTFRPDEIALLSNIISDLADMNDDSGHRTVTDTEKSTWNGKSTVSVSSTGTSTNEVNYITVNGTSYKIGGSGGTKIKKVVLS